MMISLYFKNVFENAGALHRIISFVNTTEDPPVERLAHTGYGTDRCRVFCSGKA
jgi:vacuolar-type H+-ATPase subunit B/Vma2